MAPGIDPPPRTLMRTRERFSRYIRYPAIPVTPLAVYRG